MRLMRIQRLKLLYALAGLLFAGYYSAGLIRYHLAEHVPMSMATLFCLVLFVSIPAIGYVFLFMLFPLAGRLLRR